jgi:hypothetical protein
MYNFRSVYRKGRDLEADLSAEQKEEEEGSRLSQARQHQGGAPGIEEAAGKGEKDPVRIGITGSCE